MRESTFTASLRKPLIAAGVYPLKLNVAFYRGVPDCYYSGSKRDLWNEHKYVDPIPRIVDPVKLLSALQAEWLEGRHAEGRNVAVLIGSPKGSVLLPGLTWKQPITREEFLDLALSKKKLIEVLVSYLGSKDPNGIEVSPSRDTRSAKLRRSR